jgi:apolipoprotein N-acyltransferase
MAVFRTIENGTPTLRAGTSGFSEFDAHLAKTDRRARRSHFSTLLRDA